MTKQKARNNASFEWSDEEWAILEPLEPMARMELCLKAMFQNRSLIAQAAYEQVNAGRPKG